MHILRFLIVFISLSQALALYETQRIAPWQFERIMTALDQIKIWLPPLIGTSIYYIGYMFQNLITENYKNNLELINSVNEINKTLGLLLDVFDENLTFSLDKVQLDEIIAAIESTTTAVETVDGAIAALATDLDALYVEWDAQHEVELAAFYLWGEIQIFTLMAVDPLAPGIASLGDINSHLKDVESAIEHLENFFTSYPIAGYTDLQSDIKDILIDVLFDDEDRYNLPVLAEENQDFLSVMNQQNAQFLSIFQTRLTNLTLEVKSIANAVVRKKLH